MSEEIQRALGRIEGKLDSIIDRVDSHEEKISGLEKVKTQALTIAGLVTFAMTFLWDTVKHKLGIS